MTDLPDGLDFIVGSETLYELSVFELSQLEFDLIPDGTRFVHEELGPTLYVKGQTDEKFLGRYDPPFRIGFIDGKPSSLSGKQRVSSIPGQETTWRSLLRHFE